MTEQPCSPGKRPVILGKASNLDAKVIKVHGTELWTLYETQGMDYILKMSHTDVRHCFLTI